MSNLTPEEADELRALLEESKRMAWLRKLVFHAFWWVGGVLGGGAAAYNFIEGVVAHFVGRGN